MKKSPRLLFLAQMLPYPPDGGASIRTYNVLRVLSRVFEIRALCFYRWKPGYFEPDVEAALSALGEFAEIHAFPIPQEHSPARRLSDHVRSIVNGRVYTYFTFKSERYEEALRSVLQREHFDLAHVDSLDLSGYLNQVLGRMPVTCTHHDVQSLLLERRAGRQSSFLKEHYLAHQSRLMQREEREWCPRISLNIAVSDVDCERLRAISPGSRCLVIPNGVDTDYFRPGQGAEEGVVCVGGTSWFPNRDGLEFYVESIAPILRGRAPDLRTTWVGRASPEDIEQFSIHGTHLTGYVDDIRPYVRDAACYAVPLRVGGGTRIKILDAWAMGKAVVSTSLGCEGLDARDGDNILVADDPESFADKVLTVLNDPGLRERLGRSARRTVEAKYSWEVIGEDLNEAYLDLIENEAVVPAGC